MITANLDKKVVDFIIDIDFVIIGCDGIWDYLKKSRSLWFCCKEVEKWPAIKVSKIVEEMFDSIVAKDLYNETGVGCYNMTYNVIIFKKDKGKEKAKEKEKDTEKNNN